MLAQVARWVLAGASAAGLVFLALAGLGAATGEQATLTGRVHYTLVTLATWAFVWFVQHWHLLHW